MIAVLAVVAAAIAEAMAFYCGAELLANGFNEERTGQFAPSAVTFGAVALLGLVLPRIGTELALSRRTSYAVIGVAAYVVLYGAFRIEFAHDLKLWDWSWVVDFLSSAEETARDGAPAIFGGGVLIVSFARAIWRGGADVELEYVPRSLSAPLVVVLLLVVFGAGSDRAGIIGRGAAAFFVFSVIAMALSQAALSGATFGNLRTGSVTGVLLAWTGVATVVGLLVFGVIIGSIGDEVGTLLYTVIHAVLYVVLTPIAWVLVWFFDLIIPDQIATQQQLEDLADPVIPGDEQVGVDEEGEDPAWVRLVKLVARLGILGIALLAVVGLLTLVVRLKRRGAAQRAGDATVTASGSVGADLLAGLRSLFSREGGPRKHQPAGIYQLYSEVLVDAEHRGTARQVGQTPEEFAPTLQRVYHTGLTDEITLAFEQARYAGREPDARMVADLQARWERSRHLQAEG